MGFNIHKIKHKTIKMQNSNYIVVMKRNHVIKFFHPSDEQNDKEACGQWCHQYGEIGSSLILLPSWEE